MISVPSTTTMRHDRRLRGCLAQVAYMVAGCGLLLAAAGCSGKSSTYVDKTYKYSMKLPATWVAPSTLDITGPHGSGILGYVQFINPAGLRVSVYPIASVPDFSHQKNSQITYAQDKVHCPIPNSVCNYYHFKTAAGLPGLLFLETTLPVGGATRKLLRDSALFRFSPNAYYLTLAPTGSSISTKLANQFANAVKTFKPAPA